MILLKISLLCLMRLKSSNNQCCLNMGISHSHFHYSAPFILCYIVEGSGSEVSFRSEVISRLKFSTSKQGDFLTGSPQNLLNAHCSVTTWSSVALLAGSLHSILEIRPWHCLQRKSYSAWSLVFLGYQETWICEKVQCSCSP